MKKFVLGLLCSLSFIVVSAQSKLANDGHFIFLKNGNLLDEAVFYYAENDYETALPFYKELDLKYPDDVDFTYRLGVCYTYSKNEANKALEYLLKVKRIDSSIVELNYQIGRAYYVNYQFDNAISYLAKFILQYPAHPTAKQAKLLLNSAKNGNEVLHTAQNNYVVFNADKSINTVYAEYAPLVDNANTKLYYTMRGDTNIVNGRHDKVVTTLDYNENIMLQNGTMQATPHSLLKPINSRKHDATLALYNNKLYVYKDKKRRGSGNFYVVENNKLVTLKGLNTKAWEGSATFFDGGKSVVFSSIRKHGTGGRDLYIATIKTDGTWDKALLLPNINTEFDEDAPYFDEANNTLYFSSKGYNSIGGYDVFKAKYANGTFQLPVNIGYPINSIFDDIYYTKATDNEYYFASNRTGGFGSYDIYKACTTNKLAPYKGLTLLNGKIENAESNKQFKIYAQNPITNQPELVGNFSANEFNNSLQLPLQSGVVYTIMPSNSIDTTKTAQALTVDLTSNTKQDITQLFNFTKPLILQPIAVIETSAVSANSPTVYIEEIISKPITTPKAFEIKPIYFATNSSKVSIEQEEYLKLLANDLKTKNIPQFEIMGYTDASGKDNYNAKLAQRRADVVASLLRRYGARVKYWTVKGQGVYINCQDNNDKCRVVTLNPVWD